MIGTGIGIPFRKKKRSVDDVITVDAPTNLTLEVLSDSSIKAYWDDNSDNEDGFRIYYKADGGEFAEHGTVLADIEAYEATGLTAGTLYYFYVVAYNGVIESDPTDTENAITFTAEILIFASGLVTPLSQKQYRGLNYSTQWLMTAFSETTLAAIADVIHLLAGETEESSLKNIVKNLHHCTNVHSTAFIAWEGVAPDGANDYLDTNYNSKTQGSVHVLNSASLGLYSRTNSADGDVIEMGARVSSTGIQTYLFLRLSSNICGARVNQTGSTGAAAGANYGTFGPFIGTRTANNVTGVYKEKILHDDGTSNSTDLPNYNQYVCCINQNGSPTAFSPKKKALDFYAKGLDITGVGKMIDFFDIYIANSGSDFFVFDGYSKPLSPQNMNPAICYNDKTYIAYNALLDNPYIMYYDNLTKFYSPKVKIGTNPVINDRHEQPALLIDNDGYIHCFFGCHNTAIKYSKSTNPEDITAWTAMSDIDTDATYPQALQLSDGTIYLFYRKDAGAWGYITSTDGGTSWSAFTTILEWKCYTYVRLDDNDIIHIEFNGGLGTSAYSRKNIHYMYKDGATYKDISGNVISIPFDRDHIPAGTLVYDCGSLSTVNAEMRIFNGKPYFYFADNDVGNPGDFTFKFAKYNSGWQISTIITTTLTEVYNKGVMDVISDSEIHIYQMVAAKFEKWISINGGTTWAKDSEIFDDGEFYIDPVLVLNGQDEARYLFQQNGEDEEQGMKVYLYGNKGFV